MREPLFGHQMIRFNGRIDVTKMNAESDTHEHMLRPLYNLRRRFGRDGGNVAFNPCCVKIHSCALACTCTRTHAKP